MDRVGHVCFAQKDGRGPWFPYRVSSDELAGRERACRLCALIRDGYSSLPDVDVSEARERLEKLYGEVGQGAVPFDDGEKPEPVLILTGGAYRETGGDGVDLRYWPPMPAPPFQK